MKQFIATILTLAIALTGIISLFAPLPVAAQGQQQICEGSGGKWAADPNDPTRGTCTSADNRTVMGTIKSIIDVLVFIVSAVSVLMIIIGGLRYATSGGDQNATSGAKNTILYAVIGLIVAIMAYAIVHFVLGALGIK